MERLNFSREFYPRVALIKAAYYFSDRAYFHLDADDKYFYVEYEMKPGEVEITEKDFLSEILSQSVRHEIYRETKNIRELLLARAMATSVVLKDSKQMSTETTVNSRYEVSDILKDWFEKNEGFET